MTWYPASGQLALIELADDTTEDSPLTGVVVGNGDGSVVIDLGASPRPESSPCDVVVSFFTPEALYRVTGVATERSQSPGLVDLAPTDIERVQRRAVPRVRAALPVALSAFDQNGDFSSVTGETVDVGSGGCRVQTNRPFVRGVDPTVSITLPEGPPVVVLAEVLERVPTSDREGTEYRLRFLTVDDDDLVRLKALVASAA
ncbi:MAG: PilZ protein [Acidimicrobiales bacterium]|nr:PilZ protein [Acidimicrobiales bacterium]